MKTFWAGGIFVVSVALFSPGGWSATLSIPANVPVAPGATFDLPVNISGVTGLLGYFLELQFDANIEFLGAGPGTLVNAWGPPESNSVTGGCVVAASSPTAATGTGGLVVLHLRANASAPNGHISPVTFNAVELNDGSIPATAQPGSVRIARVVEIQLADDFRGEPGTEFNVPVSLDDATGVLGFYFTVGYDSALLEYLGITPGSLPVSWGTPAVNLDPNEVVVAASGSTALSGATTLATLEFRIAATAPLETSTTVQVNETELNDGAIAVTGNLGAAPMGVVIGLPRVQFSPVLYGQSEMSTAVALTVTLDGPAGTTCSVQYQTSSGTAISGSDFFGRTGTLVFDSPSVSQIFGVNIIDDGEIETVENFTVTLSNPVGCTLAPTYMPATVNLYSNDVVQATVYVNFSHTGGEQGTLSKPYNTVAEGIAGVTTGGTVNFDGGATDKSSAWTGTINRAMTLRANPVGAIKLGVAGAASKSSDDAPGGGEATGATAAAPDAAPLERELPALPDGRRGASRSVQENLSDEETAGGNDLFDGITDRGLPPDETSQPTFGCNGCNGGPAAWRDWLSGLLPFWLAGLTLLCTRFRGES